MATPPWQVRPHPAARCRDSAPPGTSAPRFARHVTVSCWRGWLYQWGSSGDIRREEVLSAHRTPMPKMLFKAHLWRICEPEPFTVATLMLKSLITRGPRATFALQLTEGQVSCRHLAEFPSEEFEDGTFLLQCDYISHSCNGVSSDRSLAGALFEVQHARETDMYLLKRQNPVSIVLQNPASAPP